MRKHGPDNPNPPKRSEVKPGDAVWIIEKENYGTTNYTQGIVKEILTSKGIHPRGIKVRLTDGTVGRVQWKMSD
ncbi:MAG: YwbE family protein [Candidatus Jorgensenbacteria bacterium]